MTAPLALRERRIEAAARAICQARDLNPLHQVMSGDLWDSLPEDGFFLNSRGERFKLVSGWRKFVAAATLALDAADAVEARAGEPQR